MLTAFYLLIVSIFSENDLSRSLKEGSHIYAKVFFTYFAITTFFYLLTWRDPGYVLPIEINLQEEFKENEIENGNVNENENGLGIGIGIEGEVELGLGLSETETNENILLQYHSLTTNNFKTHDSEDNTILIQNDQTLHYDYQEEQPALRYCKFCDLWQPLRSKHCVQCEKCVLRYENNKYQKQFSKYIDNNVEPGQVIDMYLKAHKLIGENPVFEKKNKKKAYGKQPDSSVKRLTLEERKERARQKIIVAFQGMKKLEEERKNKRRRRRRRWR
ncbi:palmitoyltransferase zdhhc12-related [Anaeramoeba flamelloides]|uniref:Palmitoyltransferase n=1 Tax=Anaeramoeba flamelloides TaxID=1746091 RepID=A0ABQ8ZA99_9EUKA|nr:palmitoyltransferase zdhhc12-related [Anaeramoeba flamelloides]